MFSAAIFLPVFCHFCSVFDGKSLVNNVDSDQMPHYVVPDLGLHCLCMSHSGVSR